MPPRTDPSRCSDPTRWTERTGCPAGADGGAGGTKYPEGMRYSVLVETRPREGIADPEGATIERSLPALGFQGVADVRVGKAFRFTIDAADIVGARREVEDMCARFLSNPVIDDVEITVYEPEPAR